MTIGGKAASAKIHGALGTPAAASPGCAEAGQIPGSLQARGRSCSASSADGGCRYSAETNARRTMNTATAAVGRRRIGRRDGLTPSARTRRSPAAGRRHQTYTAERPASNRTRSLIRDCASDDEHQRDGGTTDHRRRMPPRNGRHLRAYASIFSLALPKLDLKIWERIWSACQNR